MFSHHLQAHFSCVQLRELHWGCSCPGLRRAAPSSSSLCKLPARRMSWQRQLSPSAAGDASCTVHLSESADASMVLTLTQGMHKVPIAWAPAAAGG